MIKNRFFWLLVLAFSWSGEVVAQRETPLVTRTEPELLAILDSAASRKEKADACVELSVIGSSAAVPTLVKLLPDAELSHMARYALQTLPGREVDGALREALASTNGRQLLGVISSLGARHDAQAVRPLRVLLEAADDEVVQAAARAMGQIGGSRAADALLRVLPGVAASNTLAVQEGLLRCAEGLAQEGDGRRALEIYGALAALSSADHQVRAAALRGRVLTSPRAAGLALLREGLKDEDYVLAAAAVRSAQEMAGSEVTLALTAELMDLPTDRQILVLANLGERGDVTALPALERVVREGEVMEARVAAVEAMAGMREPDGVRLLVEWAQSPEPALAEASKESLAALPFPGVEAAVMGMLNSADSATRLTGLELVGRRRMDETMPVLLRAAEDSDAKIRSAALRRVGELGTLAEVERLLELLARAEGGGERDGVEQALTAIASRTSPSEAVVRPVVAAWESSQAPSRAVLVRVLGVVGGRQALERVRAAVDDGDAEVHTAALRTLSTWRTVDAAPALLALAKSVEAPADRALCLRGVLAWVRNSDLDMAQRLVMCDEVAPLIQSAEERKQMLSAAGSIRSAEALRFVTPHLKDETIRAEAATAVAAIAEALLKVPMDEASLSRLRAALEAALEAAPGKPLADRLEALQKEVQERK